MGAWGAGPFENDEAMDFVDGLIDMSASDREKQIRAALTLGSGYLDVSDACTAIAAAGLVAVASGMPVGDFGDVAEVAESEGIPDPDQVRELVFAVLSRVTDDESEWRELWDEADSLEEAQAELDKIRTSLET